MYRPESILGLEEVKVYACYNLTIEHDIWPNENIFKNKQIKRWIHLSKQIHLCYIFTIISYTWKGKIKITTNLKLKKKLQRTDLRVENN